MKKIFFLCVCFFSYTTHAQVSCNNWLQTPSVPSSIRIGQLNIPGTQLTVEAVINRTSPYFGGQVWAGDVVSKHRNPTDANYLLRPNSGEITTTSGYFKTPDIADIQLNQTYHIAMVYDGDSLKFYRNGCLMSEIHATGDLIQNSWEASIGYYSPELFPDENFIGYINEVRIWNVARTQAQIQTYMNTSLPNPTTQTGLLAYYTFDNLINKQGNSSWNGTINGSASINQTNPSCNPIVNACKVSCHFNISKSADTSICASSAVNLFSGGGTSYSWMPSATLDNPASATPVALPSATTRYYVTVTDSTGCSKTDSVLVSVNALPSVTTTLDTSICQNSSVPIQASGGVTYDWLPSAGLSNSHISNPLAAPIATTKYYVNVINAAGCSKKDSVTITVKNLPVVTTSSDSSICRRQEIQISATGGTNYLWKPSGSLSNDTIPNPLASPTTSTTYFVTVTNAAGCSKEDSVTIKVKNLPVVAISRDSSICQNASIPIYATGGTSYVWSPSAGLNNNTIDSPLASPVSTTKYFVSVTNAAGCTEIDSVTIKVDTLPAISISADTAICPNSSVALHATGGTSYTWTPAGSLSHPASADPLASPAASTTYYLTVTKGNCSARDSVAILVYPTPVIAVSNDTSVCSNSPVTLFASGGSAFQWTPASTLDNSSSATPSASTATTTLYHVQITDHNSCKYTDSVKVSVIDTVAFSISSDKQLCSQTPVQLTASGGNSYVWFPAGHLNNPSIPNPVATPDSTTAYGVVIKDSVCKRTDTLFSIITVIPAPLVTAFHSNDIDCSIAFSKLSATGAATYTWSPATGLDNFMSRNPNASPEETTTYTVTGKDENGCSNSDTVTVKVNFNGSMIYGLPNSFTPNNDGLNDCFGVAHWGAVTGLDFSIYNRWGQRVFHTSDPNNCWDGTFEGHLQPEGVFVYIIKAKTACGAVNTRGIVTLIR